MKTKENVLKDTYTNQCARRLASQHYLSSILLWTDGMTSLNYPFPASVIMSILSPLSTYCAIANWLSWFFSVFLFFGRAHLICFICFSPKSFAQKLFTQHFNIIIRSHLCDLICYRKSFQKIWRQLNCKDSS